MQPEVLKSSEMKEQNLKVFSLTALQINYTHELWRRCFPPAAIANPISSMVDPTEYQLDQADQHTAIQPITITISLVFQCAPITAPAICREPLETTITTDETEGWSVPLSPKI